MIAEKAADMILADALLPSAGDQVRLRASISAAQPEARV